MENGWSSHTNIAIGRENRPHRNARPLVERQPLTYAMMSIAKDCKAFFSFHQVKESAQLKKSTLPLGRDS